ncbi:MAG: hypothetical protein R6X34_06655 [Chloroflexota bacterium]
MKIQCNHCGEWKDESEFNWRWKALGIRQGACKTCKANQDKSWYQSKGEEHKDKTVQKKRESREEARQYVWNYLTAHSCVDCGETNPAVLEFDHVSGDKTKSISAMVSQGYSIGRIEKEISKCEVRCANCHRNKTSKDRGWFRG